MIPANISLRDPLLRLSITQMGGRLVQIAPRKKYYAPNGPLFAGVLAKMVWYPVNILYYCAFLRENCVPGLCGAGSESL